jgi:hypothetical protein
MAKNLEKIAGRLGATRVVTLPETGGGTFGAARLAKLVASLQARLEPSEGRRPGRPTDPLWVHHSKVPMSERTRQKLLRLAQRASTPDRKVSPMQVAAQMLEDAVEAYPSE